MEACVSRPLNNTPSQGKSNANNLRNTKSNGLSINLERLSSASNEFNRNPDIEDARIINFNSNYILFNPHNNSDSDSDSDENPIGPNIGRSASDEKKIRDFYLQLGVNSGTRKNTCLNILKENSLYLNL